MFTACYGCYTKQFVIRYEDNKLLKYTVWVSLTQYLAESLFFKYSLVMKIEFINYDALVENFKSIIFI